MRYARAHCLLFAAGFAALAAGDPRPGPFAFLEPDVVLEGAERRRLDAGETIVRILPGRDGHVALTAAVRVTVPPERFVRWMADVVALQRGKYMPEIHVFSTPPQLSDLDALVFDAGDLDDLQRCQPGDCALKLSAAEMATLRAIGRGPQSHAELQRALRRVVLQRAADYLARGDAGAPPYHDDAAAVAPGDVVASLVARIPFLPKNFQRLTNYARLYPAARDSNVVVSTLYWSKEHLGAKPIVSITHLSVARFANEAMPATIAVAKQVYATHYRNGALTITALTGEASHQYVVYIHRSHVDVLQGVFGSVLRRMIERRVRDEAPAVLANLRRRIEAGDPSAVR
jgi:hypothetical protein